MEITNYKSLLKNIGRELVVLNTRFRVVGIYDDSYSVYYIAYDGKNEIFTPCVFHYQADYKSDEKLANIATPEKCMEKISIISDTAYCYIKDGVIYAKELYSEPYELGYIFYNGNEYRFETEININYNHKTNEFEYTNPIYKLYLHNKNYAQLKSNIKKAYVNLTQRFMDKKLSDKEAEEFVTEFVYAKEYKEKKNAKN